MRKRLGIFLISSILGSMLALTLACASEPTPEPTATPEPTPAGPSVQELKSDVVAHYANGVHALYTKSLNSATAMDTAIDIFLAESHPGYPGSREARLAGSQGRLRPHGGIPLLRWPH